MKQVVEEWGVGGHRGGEGAGIPDDGAGQLLPFAVGHADVLAVLASLIAQSFYLEFIENHMVWQFAIYSKVLC